MSTPLRVSRGAVEKSRRYNEELPLRRIAYGTQGGTIDPKAYRPRLREVISLLKAGVCNEESLLETRVEESFLSGINFFIVLVSFRRTLRSILCACFLCHRRRIFLVPLFVTVLSPFTDSYLIP